MQAVPSAADNTNVAAKLSSPELRSLVQRLVRRRVPEVDVEDVVQTVLCDALASAKTSAGRADDTGPALDDEEQLRKWVVGITRHKVADFHRRGSKAKHVELPEQLEGEAPPHSAREWARWAEEQAGEDTEDRRTLNWMAREGGGEKLAHIAASERLPATQVRQRVSRMRRFMKRQWVAELAAVAGVGLAVLVVWYLTRDPVPVAKPVPDVVPVPDTAPAPIMPADPRVERAHQLRADALRECDRKAWERCLAGLDEAARLDPGGDEDAQVQGARAAASQALEEQQQVEQKQAPAPQPSTPPPVKPPYFDKKGPPQKFNQQLKPDPEQPPDNKSLPMDPMPNQRKEPEPPPAQPPVNEDQSSKPSPQQAIPPVKSPPQPPPQQSQQSSTKGSWSSIPNQAPAPKKPRPQKKKQSKQSKKKTGKSQWRTKGGK
ncbi:MAG: sigma-70 family RNA polymerase sigma factor [Deltaproteobacteria bacterium]|nr:sigma-70 family RNA polymerase sigma factor [Deltaproteobacteria bacterium]